MDSIPRREREGTVMAKFEDQFLSVQSLATKYDCHVKTIRRFLKRTRKAGLKIKTRKIMDATRYSESDVETAIEKMDKRNGLGIK